MQTRHRLVNLYRVHNQAHPKCKYVCRYLPQWGRAILSRDGFQREATLARLGCQMDKKIISNNDNDMLISINVLEFILVMLNYRMAHLIIETTKFTEDPTPVILA